MSIDFNPELDKITEKEVVPSFFSRLEVGSSISFNYIKSEKNASIIGYNEDVINVIRSLLDTTIADTYIKDNITKFQTSIISGEEINDIQKNNGIINILFYGKSESKKLYKAIELSTGFDITNLFEEQIIEITDKTTDEEKEDYNKTITFYDPNYKIDSGINYIKIYTLNTNVPYINSKGIMMYWE